MQRSVVGRVPQFRDGPCVAGVRIVGSWTVYTLAFTFDSHVIFFAHDSSSVQYVCDITLRVSVFYISIYMFLAVYIYVHFTSLSCALYC